MDPGDLFGTVVDVLLLIVAGVFSFRWFVRAKNRRQGLLRGGIAGAVVGLIMAFTIGVSSALLHPEDASAGSVAIVGIVTFPVGFVVGALIGVLRRTGEPQSDSG